VTYRLLEGHVYHCCLLTHTSYNGTSDLQLERMNVYFNEV
jgi:hypothetical protein